jgi:nicotinamidase-related amidase
MKRFFQNTELPNTDGYAHLIIDVQRHFCDPTFSKYGSRKTKKTSKKIAKIKKDFEKAAMATYVIYYQNGLQDHTNSYGGFYKISLSDSDKIIGKPKQSAFFGTGLAEELKKHNIHTLLVSGFDISVCVNASVQDGLKENFNVWVLKDCIGNGGPANKSHNNIIKLMTDNGAKLLNSNQALKAIGKNRTTLNPKNS